MKVSTKNIVGKTVKDNDTYLLEDNNLLNNLTLSKTTLKPGKSTNGHSHEDEDEVYFFTKGWGIMKIGDKEYSAKDGDIFLIPSGKFHQVSNSHSEEYSCEFICVFQKYDRASDTAKYNRIHNVDGPNGAYGV